MKLVGKKIEKHSNIIFCMDTPKEQVWRTELKCDYKGDRFDMSQKTNLLPAFKYTYNTIIPNLLKNNNNMFKIRLNKLEADDVIATICIHYKNKLDQKVVKIIKLVDIAHIANNTKYLQDALLIIQDLKKDC
jgi:hypothetical protein